MYFVAFILALGIAFFLFKIYLFVLRIRVKQNHRFSIGIFHPYCNAGGGGERVLWVAVRAIQRQYNDALCVIYTGDDVKNEDILKNVQSRFNISLSREVKFVHLKTRAFVEAKYYPYFTLLLQSLGSIILGLEALFKFSPDIYIDTMGYAFTLPIFTLLGSCRVGCYVHFPTISTDMLEVVQSRTTAVNNRRFISNSNFFSQLKFVYYKIFALLYGAVGRFSEVIMVNSSWTSGHIVKIFARPRRTFTVYPPCDVSEFNNISLERHQSQEQMRIISVAQFRPEKNHQLQLKCFKEFLNRLGNVPCLPKLVLIGSCRHEDDFARVKHLSDMCKDLEIENNVEFRINLTFQDLINEMTNSSVALHTMTNEHFGIGVVECLSAGLITVAHDSGGPKMDIISTTKDSRTGFLASDVTSYADALEKIYKMSPNDSYKIRQAARESVSKFSDQKFESSFLSVTKSLFITFSQS